MNGATLHLHEYDLQLRGGVRLGYNDLTRRAGLVVAIDSGEPNLMGLGEAAPAWWAGDEALDTARAALAAARDWFERVRPDAGELEAGLRNGASLPTELAAVLAPSGAAASAIATALCDHQARRRELSMTEYLGGRLGVCTTNDLVTAETVGDIAAEVGRSLALDYRTVKLKVGGRDTDADLARIATVLDLGHGRLRLRLDANGAWNMRQAAAVLSKLDRRDIDYVEEPLADPTPYQLIALTERCDIAIAMDESIRSDDDVDRFAHACDVLVLKPGRVLGPWAALTRARRATTAGLSVTFTDSLESCVGRAACLHLALSAGDGRHASGLAGAALLREDLSTDPQLLRGASIEPTGPGLLPHEALKLRWQR